MATFTSWDRTAIFQIAFSLSRKLLYTLFGPPFAGRSPESSANSEMSHSLMNWKFLNEKRSFIGLFFGVMQINFAL